MLAEAQVLRSPKENSLSTSIPPHLDSSRIRLLTRYRPRVTCYARDTIRFHRCVAWDSSSRMAGPGWFFRVNTEATTTTSINELSDSSRRPHVNSALEAEAWAILEALSQARTYGYKEIHVFSDCQTLINLLNSSALHTEIQSIVDDIRALCSSFTHLLFSFIPRCSNSKADALAKSALREFVTNIVP
ncbi:unnamed protein product [Arabidopsis halleri]